MTPEAARRSLSLFPSPHQNPQPSPVTATQIPLEMVQIGRTPQFSPLTAHFSQMHTSSSHSSQSSTQFSSSVGTDWNYVPGSFQNLLSPTLLGNTVPGLEEIPGFTQYTQRAPGYNPGDDPAGSQEDLGTGADEQPQAEVNSPTGGGTQGQRRRRAAVRWSFNEEEVLLHSWIHVSTDGTTGADQSGDCFWRKVHHMCKMSRHSKFFAERTTGSVKKHFGDLNKKLKQFAGCLARAEDGAGSGMNDANILTNAQREYQLLHGPWQLADHWEIVKEQPAWNIYSTNPRPMAYQMRKPAKSGSTSSGKRSHSETTGDDEANMTPPVPRFPARPLGRDLQKRAAAMAGGSSGGASGGGAGGASGSRAAKGKQKMAQDERLHNARASHRARELEQRKAAIEKEIARQEKRRERLLSMILDFRKIDKSNYTPEQVEEDRVFIANANRDLLKSNEREDELRLELGKLNSFETMPISSDSDSE